MKILVIDDEPEVRATLRDMLEINGHEVLLAEDGLQGLRRVAEGPDFIFCDVAMPGLDGHGVLRALRQTPAFGQVPFVFLTARAEREDQRAGMALGACDYLTKPFSEKEILDVIAVRSALRRQMREKLDAFVERRRDLSEAPWAHELLTPLNAVLGGLQLLEIEADTIGREELRELLALIRAGAERQERVARKLIRYFDLERRADRAASGVVSGSELGVCCASVVCAAASRAARELGREADLVVEAEEANVPLLKPLLEDAVTELVENAFRFSSPGSVVDVRGRREGADYEWVVADQGTGMSAEERAGHGPFRQFGRSLREQPGLGLGLAIASGTGRLAGGGLRLEPGSERGLRAILRVPLAVS